MAGILGAAMGSLSSALNSMSNSTVADFIHSFFRKVPSDDAMLRLARVMTLVWAVLMAVFACAFSSSTGNVYLTGLTIAGYTYGALLGAFLLGRLVKRANQVDAVIAFLVTVAVMTYIVRYVKIDVTTAGTTTATAIAAQWLVPIGVLITLVVGAVSAGSTGPRRRRTTMDVPTRSTTTRRRRPPAGREGGRDARDRPDVRNLLRRHRSRRGRVRAERDTLRMRPLGRLSHPYSDELRTQIAAALPPAATTTEAICVLDTGIGQAFAEAGVRALAQLCDGHADLVVSHGQTMHHWVEAGTVRGTLQLGQPAWIAEATGLPVVSDLRSRDVAAGGQGAPLVALFDALLLGGLPGVPAALNLGGIANITVVAPDADPLAFDTGPANALLDAAARHFSGGTEEYDRDGRGAAAGQVNPDLLRRLLDEPYYRLPGPKSTGKELFHLPYLLAALADAPTPDPQDVLATLTRLTAVTVAERLPRPRRHPARRLRRRRTQPDADAHDRRRAARRPAVLQ